MTSISFKADFKDAEIYPSPNFGERKNAQPINMLILHYTGMQNGLGAQEWLCSEQSQVSSHYLVHEDGRVVQMVSEQKRAWHAGKSFWKGQTDINSCSIGIEIVNGGHEFGMPAFPDVQMKSVIKLCQSIVSRCNIPKWHILGHSDVAPVRKVDPGEKFNWELLAQAGIGHFVEPATISSGRYFSEGDSGQPVEALQAMLSLYGYDIDITGIFDGTTKGVIEAFQRHFRPKRIDGVADLSTIDTLHRLLKTLPEDSSL